VTPIELFLLALALAADAFSVGVASGVVCRGLRPTFRLAFHFGLFQALMPALGVLSGSLLRGPLGALDSWIAFGLLALIGGRMVVASFGDSGDRSPAEPRRDPSRGLAMVGLSLATSIDAYGAGIGLALTDVDVLTACLVIGLVAGLLTVVGLRLGGFLARGLGPWAERIGGLVLIGIGVRILLAA